MKVSPVILYLASQDTNHHAAHVSQLARYGLVVTGCTSVVQAQGHIAVSRGSGALPVVVILAGDQAENGAAATALRALYVNIGIIALADSLDEAGLIHQLQSGADTYCAAQASPDLLAAIVFRLLWRMGASSYPQLKASPNVAEPAKTWHLAEQDWVLCLPDGRRVSLTTAERTFLSTLLNAPHQRASHDELMRAMNGPSELSGPRGRQARLGVMVSRLRRKFSQMGAPLPLKSVHNWGYMFASDQSPAKPAGTDSPTVAASAR